NTSGGSQINRDGFIMIHLHRRAVFRAIIVLFLASQASAEVKYYGVFTEAPPTTIAPQGWEKEMLHRQVEGLAKHHAISGYPYDTCLWAGKIPPDPNPKAKAWWPYE